MSKRIVALLFLLVCLCSAANSQAKIPTPAEILGFTPGDDRKLASWDQVVDYFQRLDKVSDRVTFETLGTTTMGKPFVMATISSPANLARLEEYKKIQDQLADPRKLGPLASRDRKAAELIRKGKMVVLGLVTSKSGTLESKDELKRRIDQAARFIDLDQLCLSPQCGFASTEEGNILAEDEQWAKLRRIVEVADEVWG